LSHQILIRGPRHQTNLMEPHSNLAHPSMNGRHFTFFFPQLTRRRRLVFPRGGSHGWCTSTRSNALTPLPNDDTQSAGDRELQGRHVTFSDEAGIPLTSSCGPEIATASDEPLLTPWSPTEPKYSAPKLPRSGESRGHISTRVTATRA
jgi:hypothetical protein